MPSEDNAETDIETGMPAFELRLYDPRINRWIAPDPAGQYDSPYLAMGNNWITGVDSDGAKNIRFDENGNYVGVDHDVWWHNLLFGNRGQYSDGNGNWNNFSFADPDGDWESIQNGDLTKLVFVEENEIQFLLEEGGAFNEKNRVNAIDYLKVEGKGFGNFDFAYTIASYYGLQNNSDPWQNIYLVNEKSVTGNFAVAHNPKNFGNYLFGAGAHSLKVSNLLILLGAHYNSLANPDTNGYKPQFDSSDDQYSIDLGVYHSNNNNYRSIIKN